MSTPDKRAVELGEVIGRMIWDAAVPLEYSPALMEIRKYLSAPVAQPDVRKICIHSGCLATARPYSEFCDDHGPDDNPLTPELAEALRLTERDWFLNLPPDVQNVMSLPQRTLLHAKICIAVVDHAPRRTPPSPPAADAELVKYMRLLFTIREALDCEQEAALSACDSLEQFVRTLLATPERQP